MTEREKPRKTSEMQRRDFLKLMVVGGTTVVLTGLGVFGCQSKQEQPKQGESKQEQPKKSDTFPKKEIRLIIGYSAGGGTDVAFRSMVPFVEKRLGVPIVVENHPGASGGVALRMCKQAPPDGYTLSHINLPNDFVRDFLNPPKEWDIRRDFKPVVNISYAVVGVFLHKDTPINTWDEFVAWAKKQDQSGKPLTACGTGLAGRPVMDLLFLQELTGSNINYVPYQGGGNARAAMIGKQHDIWLAASDEFDLAKEHLKPILFYGPKLPGYEKVTSIHDIGASQFEDIVSRSVIVRKEVPDEVYQKLCSVYWEAMNSPEAKKAIKEKNLFITPQKPEWVQKQWDHWYNTIQKYGDKIKKLIEGGKK